MLHLNVGFAPHNFEQVLTPFPLLNSGLNLMGKDMLGVLTSAMRYILFKNYYYKGNGTIADS